MRQLGLDPAAGLARVAADEQPGCGTAHLAVGVRQRAHERGAEPPDRRRIERILAGGAADAVGAEQSRWRDSFSFLHWRFCTLNRRRIDMRHASLIRGGRVHGEHVVARAEAGEIDVGAHRIFVRAATALRGCRAGRRPRPPAWPARRGARPGSAGERDGFARSAPRARAGSGRAPTRCAASSGAARDRAGRRSPRSSAIPAASATEIVSVSASRARLTALSGPTISTRSGRPIPCRRHSRERVCLPSTATTGTSRVTEGSNDQRNRGRVDLHHFDAERHAHLLRRQRKQPVARHAPRGGRAPRRCRRPPRG